MTAETPDGGGAAASRANHSSVSSVEVTTMGSSTSAQRPLLHGFSTAEIVPVNVLVEGQWVFYNHSEWDGKDAAASANHDSAIAPDELYAAPACEEGRELGISNVSAVPRPGAD